MANLPKDPDDQTAEAKQVRVGASSSGGINAATDVDLHRVDVAAYQWLRFDVDHVSGELDSFLRLMLEDGGTFLTNDNANAPGEAAGAPTEAYFDFFFTNAGTYYVGVSDARNPDYNPTDGLYDRAGATGKYKLVVSEIPPPRDTDDEFDEARTLGTAATARDTIGDRDVDMYKFSVAKESVVELRVAALDAGVYLRVYNEAGEPVAENSGSLNGLTLPAGTYRVAVSGDGNTDYDPVTGERDVPASQTRYELALAVTPVPPPPPPPPPPPADPDDQLSEAKAISIGSTANGRIDPAGDVDMLKLSVPAGRELVLRLDGSTVPVVLRVLSAVGEDVIRSDHTFTFLFEDGGTYYVGVSSVDNGDYNLVEGTGDNPTGAQGDYSLAVQLVPDDADDQISEAAGLGVNSSRSGTLSGDFDVDVYAFKVTAGQRVAFDIDIPASNTVGDTLLRLFDADGVVLAGNDDAASPGEEEGGESYLEYVFQAAGTYFVAVSGSGNGGYDVNTGRGDSIAPGGAYTLRVSSPPASG